MRVLLMLISGFLIYSCSCEWHINRAEKKCGEIRKDTLTVHDTVITKEVKRDTIFRFFQRDTVIIREGKLTMKYFYRDHDSTVYLQGKCISDTIIKEIRVPFDQTVVEVDYFPPWVRWALLIICLLLLIRWFFNATAKK